MVALVSGTATLSLRAEHKKPTPKGILADTLSYNDSRRYQYFFLEAVRQQNAGHYAAAFDLLSHCLEINPKAPEAWYLKAMYYAMLGHDTTTLAYLEKASALNPDNSTYLERVAQYYINAKDYSKAIDAYERLGDRHRDRTDVLDILTSLYQQQNKYDKMLETIARYERIDGQSEASALAKMRVYELKGDRKNALKTLKGLADDHPNDINYKLMMGNWLMQNDRKDDAFAIYSAAEREDSANSNLQTALFDYYNAVGKTDMAATYRDRILLNQDTEAQSKVTMMRQVIADNEAHGGDSTQVLRLFDRILSATPNDSTMAELKAAYMTLKKMPAEDVNHALYRVLELSPDNAAARFQLIQSLWGMQQWDKIIALAAPGTEYNPEELAFYYFLGLAQYQKDEKDKALNAFRRGVGVINHDSNADVVSDFYAIMGDILHDKGLTKEAYAAYDSCLQWKPDNYGCLNNYAYYLSEEGQNLQKAEQMSYKTVAYDSKNATYLDTYAWILFRQERFAEARIYIDQAVENDTDSVPSGVVLEHAGDIHAKNNDLEKALTYWEQALKSGTGSPLLPKKIKLKKYIAP